MVLLVQLIVISLLFSVGPTHSSITDETLLNSRTQEIISKKNTFGYINFYRAYCAVSAPNRNFATRRLSSEREPIDLSYACIHDHIANQTLTSSSIPQIEEYHDFPDASTRQSSNFQPLRFLTNLDVLTPDGDVGYACYSAGSTVNVFGNTHTCRNEDLLTPALQTFFREGVAPAIVEVMEQLLRVIPVTGTLRFRNNDGLCLDGYSYPPSYFSPGISGRDFILFIAGRPAPRDGTVAYATTCFTLDGDGRPVMGMMNFAPRHFRKFETSGFSSFEFEGAVKVGIHELTHALGFSSNLYNTFRNSNGQTYTPTTSFQVSGVSPAGQSYSVTLTGMSTPNVLAFARAHYGCPDLEVVELEDFGGSGTAGSHWEMRVVGNEYMAGFINPLMPISGLTLSLFEDMGWYRVNKNVKFEYYGFGKDQGCDFVRGRCSTAWLNRPGYFCSSTRDGCTADRTGKGQCAVVTYSNSLPPYYQHFTNPARGGNIQAADHCPFTYASTASRHCADLSNSGSGEYFGEDSLCWEYATGTNSISQTSPLMSCWRFECQGDSLRVNIQNQWFTCPPNGGNLNVSPALNGGTITCPTTSQICRNVGDFIHNPQTTGNSLAYSFTQATTESSTTPTETPTGDTPSEDSSETQTVTTSTSTTGVTSESAPSNNNTAEGREDPFPIPDNISSPEEMKLFGVPLLWVAGGAVGLIVICVIVLVVTALFLRNPKPKQTSTNLP